MRQRRPRPYARRSPGRPRRRSGRPRSTASRRPTRPPNTWTWRSSTPRQRRPLTAWRMQPGQRIRSRQPGRSCSSTPLTSRGTRTWSRTGPAPQVTWRPLMRRRSTLRVKRPATRPSSPRRMKSFVRRTNWRRSSPRRRRFASASQSWRRLPQHIRRQRRPVIDTSRRPSRTSGPARLKSSGRPMKPRDWMTAGARCRTPRPASSWPLLWNPSERYPE